MDLAMYCCGCMSRNNGEWALMCGIVTIYSKDPSDHSHLPVMMDDLFHRGPDDSGSCCDMPVSMGHRRLSIIDLSAAGRQPMINEDGSLYLVCNGEIYNYLELTTSLKRKGHVFRSQSDSEVLLHLYEEKGEALLDDVNGMFAFAIWDSRKKKLICAVDRFGKKPLYYVCKDGRLACASELKSLLRLPWVGKGIDYQALDRYLSLRYVPAPFTMLTDVRKMEMSSLMVWQNGSLSFKTYWRPDLNPLGSAEDAGLESFDLLLKDAVRLRLRSDVPVGVYLSGGVDSAAIAGLMKELGGGEKISYTASFDYAYDESPRASRLASYLGFEYNSVTMSGSDFDMMGVVQHHLDEPFGDMLALPAYLLAKKAKEKLTVVLTGDGADEILNGYLHQKIMIQRHAFRTVLGVSGVPSSLAFLLRAVPLKMLNTLFDYPDRFGARECVKLSQALSLSDGFGTFYDGITSCFTSQDKSLLYCNSRYPIRFGHELSDEYDKTFMDFEGFSMLSRLSLMDIKYWIPFSVLFRLDKMNMAHAIETRSPFLDYRLVQMALNLPDAAKRNRKENKIILRRVIDRLYPPELREKGKQAFYVPLVASYEKSYYEWVMRLLDEERVAKRGCFCWSYIEKIMNQARCGSMLARRQLTSLAMLEQWFEKFID